MANKRHEKQRSRTVTSAQFFVIILITIALAVVLDFGQRAAVSAELQREAQQLERQVATLEAENRALQVQREWVQTDAYVEEWARTEGLMVLNGETPIVPVPASQVQPAESATPASPSESTPASPEETGETAEHWQEWWALFFGPAEKPTTPNQGE
jgi:cell division protein FtsB